MLLWNNVLCFTVLLVLSSAIFVVEVNKQMKPCVHSKTPFPWDVSELQIFLTDDDQLTMNGKIVVVTDIKPPVGLNIYTHKMEKGEWMPTPYTKQVLNFCGSMRDRHELWYTFTRYMNQTHCPIRKGHVEKFDMVPLEPTGLEGVLAELVGEWRIFTEISLGGIPPRISCVVTEVSIIEH